MVLALLRLLSAASILALVLVAPAAFAVPLIDEDVRLDPDDPATPLYRAGLKALDQGKLDEADTAFRDAVALRPLNYLPELGLADVAWRRGATGDAQAHLQRAMRVAPDAAAPQQAWGRFLYAQKRYDEAIAAYRRAIEIDPKTVGVRIDLADLYVTVKRDPATAEPLYRAALALAPEHAGARYALGNALMLRGRLDEARTELLSAAEKSPNNPLPWHLLGVVEAGRGDTAAALADFDRALRIAPRFAGAHVSRGDVLLARGQGADALAAYRKALEIDAGAVPALVGVGQANQLLGRAKDAEQAYRDALARDGEQVVALNNLAWMAAESRRDLDAALTWANKAVQLAPDVADFHGTLGWVHRARGDLPNAATALETANRIKATPELLVQLGTVYLDQGRRGDAAGMATRALALDASYAPAKSLQAATR